MSPESTGGPPRPDEVHLWLAAPEIADAAIREGCLALLSEAERQRHDRFRFSRDRDLFLAAHVLARHALSAHGDVPAGEWTFKAEKNGKPRVKGPKGAPPLAFNISHTAGLAACAVTGGSEVGVDVEHTGRSIDSGLADHYFSIAERRALMGTPEYRRKSLFYDIWTLKEAYLKACGAGLSVPLAEFSIHITAGRPPRISFEGQLEDDRSRVHLFQHSPGPRHRAAVAVLCRPVARVELVVHRPVRLVDVVRPAGSGGA